MNAHPYDVRSRACVAAIPRCEPGTPEYRLSRHLMRTAQKLADLAWESR